MTNRGQMTRRASGVWPHCRRLSGALLLFAGACGTNTDRVASNTPKVVAASDPSAYRPLCPEDGQWNQCVVLDKLVHAGVAPALDSTDTTHVKFIAPAGVNYRVGKSARLIVFYFPDSTSAKKAWDSMDTLRLVGRNDPVTVDSLLPWGRRPAAFRSANVVGAFMSDKREQVERVLAVFAAGLPAPSSSEPQKP